MRKTLQGMSPYKVTSEQADVIRLDSNEAYTSLLSYVDFSELETTLLNRYPAESTESLIEAYSKFSGFPAENILAGNGSDECITLISQYALDPGDQVIVFEPDFSMYEKNARVMGAEVTTIKLNEDFSLPLQKIKDEIERLAPKLLFLSNPNNPTGRLYENEEIEELIASMKQAGGILILDEAYMDFSGESAFAKKVLDYENLIILRTASKALGMAALRLGFVISNDRIVEGISAVKPPYNVNTVSAQIGTQLLKKPELLDQFLIMQLAQIAELEEIMSEFSSKVEGSVLYPSSANFFLMRMEGAKDLADYLYERKIKIRTFDNGSLQAVRVSAGTEEEHEKLKVALMNWSDK
ncbi:histidinol-phosphate aminotransferase family protein [Siminovitchia acidinfaciens]|uniref:Histidinol-phosphate aminotransferase family protein n=1 Tax=Siminovitchia acidinfaciens TaxID=2321395 RepID=A0A429XVE9_9BACI|nr:histidinol-phosphate transaminase [Siminovitchia acidinfaciens]RST72246.1 histidinol-phosphate aminotransferase family protein [Siminovitchia acidinfaciens]